eukprot:7736458-Pyramimonas_sp.AAC.1
MSIDPEVLLQALTILSGDTLQEGISRRDMRRCRGPMVESKLIQRILRRVADELIWFSPDDGGLLRKEDNLRSNPNAVSEGLLCDRICRASLGIAGAWKRVHTNLVRFDTASVSKIR